MKSVTGRLRKLQNLTFNEINKEIIMTYKTTKSISTTNELDLFSWKRATLGRQKLVFDECWTAETADNKVGEKHWYQQIPCSCGGFIGLYSLHPVILQFWSPKPKKTASKIYEDYKATPQVRLDNAMDGWEVVLYFPIELLHIVA